MAVARRSLGVVSCLALILAASQTQAEDWIRFRGPNGSGISDTTASTPVEFSATKNLQWKVALPGPGSSCPIVVGDQVFVTCWSGYGMERGGDPGDQNQLKRHLLSIDRNTGKIQWDKTVDAYLPEDNYGGMFAEHGYATHTPVSDGERVYVFFGKTGALAFDLEGNQLWHNDKIGTESGANNWGSSSSPILYQNVLIIPATAECEGLVGLDKETGAEIWRKEASGFNSTWGSPILVEVDENRTDVVISIPGEMWGFEPATGKFVWFTDALDAGSMCSSAIAHDGVIYAIETHRGGGSIAIKAGGTGDVKDNIVWQKEAATRIGTPLYYDGRLYTFGRGQAACYSAADGSEIFRGRLEGNGGGGRGQDYASAVFADGKIYYPSRSGDIFVLEASDTLNQLAVNRVTDDEEDFSSTPAVTDDGQIILRSDKHVYCVAQDRNVGQVSLNE
jgi:hypothetical protein